MEYTVHQACQDFVDKVIDMQLCMDCDHPRCLSRNKSLVKELETLVNGKGTE